MISYLTGKPLLNKNYLTVITNGVGYKVFAASKVMHQAQNQQEIGLFIYTHVKEDKLELYGFLTDKDLQLFELVLSVSGVGPKTALSLIDAGSNQLIDAVQNAHLAFFTKIPRVGKKLAQKIIIDLKSKLGSLKELDLGPKSQKQQDLFSALQGLGFDESNIADALNNLDIENLSIEAAIKLAIKQVNK